VGIGDDVGSSKGSASSGRCTASWNGIRRHFPEKFIDPGPEIRTRGKRELRFRNTVILPQKIKQSPTEMRRQRHRLHFVNVIRPRISFSVVGKIAGQQNCRRESSTRRVWQAVQRTRSSALSHPTVFIPERPWAGLLTTAQPICDGIGSIWRKRFVGWRRYFPLLRASREG